MADRTPASLEGLMKLLEIISHRPEEPSIIDKGLIGLGKAMMPERNEAGWEQLVREGAHMDFLGSPVGMVAKRGRSGSKLLERILSDIRSPSGPEPAALSGLWGSNAADDVLTQWEELLRGTLRESEVASMQRAATKLPKATTEGKIKVWRYGNLDNEVVSVTTDRSVAERLKKRNLKYGTGSGKADEVVEYELDAADVLLDVPATFGSSQSFFEGELLVHPGALRRVK